MTDEDADVGLCWGRAVWPQACTERFISTLDYIFVSPQWRVLDASRTPMTQAEALLMEFPFPNQVGRYLLPAHRTCHVTRRQLWLLSPHPSDPSTASAAASRPVPLVWWCSLSLSPSVWCVVSRRPSRRTTSSSTPTWPSSGPLVGSPTTPPPQQQQLVNPSERERQKHRGET